MLRGLFVIILLFFVDSIAKALLPDAYFRGIERMKDITIRAVFAKSGILVATLLFVKSDDTLITYPVSMIVFDTIALLWAFSLLKRDGLKATGTTMREMLEALKDSFWFFISRISVSINGSLGSIFLGMRYSPESVEMGLYSGATRLSSAGEQMIPPLGDALYPSMVNKKDYRLFYRIVLRGGILWFLACAGGSAGNAVVRADSRRTVRQRGRVPTDTDGRRVLRIFQFHVWLSSALADREGDLGERGDHGQYDRESYGLRGPVAGREHHTVDGVRGVLQHQYHDLHRALRRVHEI